VDLIRKLLQYGADPTALSKPFWSHMPDSIFGLRCTPQEGAAAEGPEVEKMSLDALAEHGAVLREEDEGEWTVFWDAAEDSS
jgi:hypothetical protein